MKNTLVTYAFLIVFTSSVFGQGGNIPLIGSKAPSFTASTTKGKINFPEDYGDSWKILFSHPQDFTPVCSSELLELAFMQKDLEKLGVKTAVISTDNLEQHNLWVQHLQELDYKGRGKQTINFPLIADEKGKISRIYGMLHEPASTTRDVRGVFIIDSENVVRSVNFYPMEVGRNMDEIERIIMALQTTAEAKVLTPANWNHGDDVMVPYHPYTSEQLKANPELEKMYYPLGNRIWFKKVDK